MSKTLKQPSPASVPIEPDQLAYDRRMARQTPEQRARMIKGLGDLARSKAMSEPASSQSAQQEGGPAPAPIPTPPPKAS